VASAKLELEMFDCSRISAWLRPGTGFEAAQDPEIERSLLLAEASVASRAALGGRDLGSRQRRDYASRQLHDSAFARRPP